VSGARVEVVSDPPEALISAYLADDPLLGAFALGYLTPGWREHARFWVALRDGVAVAVAAEYSETHPNSLLLFGLRREVVSLLSASQVALWRGQLRSAGEELWISAHGDALDALTGFFYPVEHRSLQRLALTGPALRRVGGGGGVGYPGNDRSPDGPRRLTSLDAPALNRLYGLDDADTFAAGELGRAAYYGFPGPPDERPALVAAAGTQVIVPQWSIAAVGNVFTLPQHRGHGYATACLSALCAHHYRAGKQAIVLNVDDGNAPALAIYHRLGFTLHCRTTDVRAVAL